MHGKEAHAGAAPEKGINAIQIASRAIADLELGRIDEETTCNIGVIQGGLATNIIPNLVKIKGEVRSHNAEKLETVTQTIVSAFEKAAAENAKAKRWGRASIRGFPCRSMISPGRILPKTTLW